MHFIAHIGQAGSYVDKTGSRSTCQRVGGEGGDGEGDGEQLIDSKFTDDPSCKQLKPSLAWLPSNRKPSVEVTKLEVTLDQD